MSEQENNKLNDKKDKIKKVEKKPNRFISIIKAFPRWLREMRSELKKVVWPTPKQIVNNTWIVIIMILIVGVCIWIFDFAAGSGIKALIGAFA